MAIDRNYLNRAFVANPPSAYAIVMGTDFGTIQASLPSITALTAVDFYVHIPNTNGQWKVGKTVSYMLPDDTDETTPIVLKSIGVSSTPYPGTTTVVALGAVMVLNGYAFKATTAGTTAASFIGFSAFNTATGGTTTDGTVVWTCYGKGIWLKFQYLNTHATVAQTPVAQTYELFQQ